FRDLDIHSDSAPIDEQSRSMPASIWRAQLGMLRLRHERHQASALNVAFLFSPARCLAPFGPGIHAKERQGSSDHAADHRCSAAEHFEAELPEDDPEQEPNNTAGDDATAPEQEHTAPTHG